MDTGRQPPKMRTWYHVASSGMLAIQMSRNWEKAM